MFNKVLIANRGAIACRIERTLRRMGIGSVAVYSEADRESRHVLDADEAFLVGPGPASASYLAVDRILAAATQSGANAIHPGYGFLSENAEFARECTQRGIAFIGPRVEQIEAFALKHTARAIAKECGVPLLPGTGILSGSNEALQCAEELGYPVMLKSSAGGGGIGMRVCYTAAQLADAYESVVRLSQNSFRDGSVYLEKFVARARARGSADLRRWQRRHPRARAARLFGAAPPSEGDRRNSRAGVGSAVWPAPSAPRRSCWARL